MATPKPDRWAWDKGLLRPEHQHLTEGLVLCYPLWERGGSTARSLARNAINLDGPIQSGASWAEHLPGAVLDNDASGAAIEFTPSDSTPLHPSDLSLVVTFFRDAVDTTSTLISKNELGQHTRRPWSLGWRNQVDLDFIMSDSTDAFQTVAQPNSGTSIAAGAWHTAVAAFNGVSLDNYVAVDGRINLTTQTNGWASFANTFNDPLRVGELSYSDIWQFNGKFAFVAVYNRYLSPSEGVYLSMLHEHWSVLKLWHPALAEYLGKAPAAGTTVPIFRQHYESMARR